jgi:DNA-binding SARP family transcriptional activator
VSRERLTALLGEVWNRQIALVVAPAGSGKTTLLAHFAAAAAAPVAWYLADHDDGTEDALVSHLEASWTAATGRQPAGRWQGIEDAVRAFESWDGHRGLIVVDDAHTIAETPAEAALERLAQYLPPSLRLIVASRRPPAWNLPRLRVSGALLEIGPEYLRFRSWEVEQLFRDFYGEPLPAADLAQLARRTEGWAAGLQLFYLATTGKGPAARHKVLASLGGRWRLAGEYLARNVLDDLPDDFRSFLVATSVLGRLNGPLCDELLGRSGSARTLEQLERRQIFTVALDGGSNYRYHEALLSHLETILVEEVGEAEAKRRYLAAGRLLEGGGLEAEALRAYGRAGEWGDVERLLGTGHAVLVGEASRLVERLPAALVANDPWLMVATARRSLAEGDLRGAAETYARAESGFGTATGKDLARRERAAAQQWLATRPVLRSEWTDLIRRATIDSPVGVAEATRHLQGPTGWFAEAIVNGLAGRFRHAAGLLLGCSEEASTSALLAAVSDAVRLLGLPGPPTATDGELAQCLDQVEQVPLPWLASVIRRLLAGRGDRPLETVEEPAMGSWGAPVISLLEGIHQTTAGVTPASAAGLLHRSAASFDRLGAQTLATWCLAWKALAEARLGSASAVDGCLAAAARARTAAVPGALALATQALAIADPGRAGEHRREAATIASEWSVDLLPIETDAVPEILPPVRPSPRPASGPSVVLRCFGGFSLSLDRQPVDIATIKPKARAVLFVLALNVGRPVHRETIGAAVWPDVETKVSLRNLQVALSAIRHLLQTADGAGLGVRLARQGDAYRLTLPDEADVDVVRFEKALTTARLATPDSDEAAGALASALDAYGGDLLPEAGPTEWVVQPRDSYRAGAAGAALRLAERVLARGECRAAIRVCERGLRIDAYQDGLWRVMVEAQNASGDRAAASRSRRAYDAVLGELGLLPAASGEWPRPVPVTLRSPNPARR